MLQIILCPNKIKSYIPLLIIFVFILITISLIFSQVTEEWVARYHYPGNYWDEANAIKVDDTGNVYVTGFSEVATYKPEWATIKYNNAGIQQWVMRYNGNGSGLGYANALAIDNLGNIYVTGSIWDGGSENWDDYATIKYNSAGVQQWVARYNGPGNDSDCAYAIVLDSSGNVYVTGYSYGSGTSADYATIKYNSEGIQQWIVRYDGPENSSWDESNDIAIDNLGNVYVTGRSEGSGIYNNYDYATVKYNSDGVEQWVVRYNGPGNDYDAALAIALDSSGNVYVTGFSVGSGTDDDYATIKYNTDGVEQWVARYNGLRNYRDIAKALIVDSLNNVYVTGTSMGLGTGDDYATLKYNTNGELLWVALYQGPWYGGSANDIAIDNSGNVYVTGHSSNSGSLNDYDCDTVKYNSNGVQQWVMRYNGPGDVGDRAESITVDNKGNVYITGGSYGSGVYDDFDYFTIKYSKSVSVDSDCWTMY